MLRVTTRRPRKDCRRRSLIVDQAQASKPQIPVSGIELEESLGGGAGSLFTIFVFLSPQCYVLFLMVIIFFVLAPQIYLSGWKEGWEIKIAE